MLQELSLTEEEIEALIDVAVVKQIKQGEKILKKGEMMDAIVAGVGGPSKSPASQGKAEGDDNVAGAAEGSDSLSLCACVSSTLSSMLFERKAHPDASTTPFSVLTQCIIQPGETEGPAKSVFQVQQSLRS